ncbi:MAG: helix-turn-helix domain-containing protein [Pseudomonadota bacterium]
MTRYEYSTQQVVALFCQKYEIDVDAMYQPGRPHHVAHPRQELMTAMRLSKRYSYPHIGKIFNRDHSTVTFAVKKVLKRAEADPEIADRIKVFARLLASKVPSHPVSIDSLRKQILDSAEAEKQEAQHVG